MAAADITAKVVAFIITPYLANRMGPSEFGSLSLYLATTEILAFALFLGGPALVAAEYVRNGETSALRVRAASIGVSLRIAPVALIGSIVASWFLPSAMPFVIGGLLVAVSYLYGLNTLELSFYRGAQSYALAVAGQFSFTVLNLLLTVAAFEFDSPTATNRLLSIALALGLVQLAYAFDLHRRTYDKSDVRIRRANTRLVTSFGLSISVHVASNWVRLSVDRFFLASYVGLASAGIYSVAIQMTIVPSVLFSVVSQQLQPYMYRRLRENKFAEFRKIQIAFTLMVAAFTVVYCGLLLIFFDRLFVAEYGTAKTLLIPLLGGSMAQAIYFIFTHAAFYERRASHISVLSGVALTAHLLCLGILAITDEVAPLNVALVYLMSSAIAAIAMAALSNRTVKQLAARKETE
jgi:O-antigen/teichoic acid export membrane protein